MTIPANYVKGKLFVIKSEHGFWRQDLCGFTEVLRDAGTFTLEQCLHNDGTCGLGQANYFIEVETKSVTKIEIVKEIV